ncbi:SusD-like starch-binding protein associating with outer membrane [Arcicella aurantiaca]|uniref:SusD-like starch-binding protein associating with outer membrane n=1 Tax=Arcicella aurantiaca TaxID=591202 RepID=A0A316EEL9_9BACT|nr:SusD/RagB family nutrient-binding outer membrane lipoprotein [Arcicella aurantiaca]PWK28158.1 SusD-like starch-binding protein associating with outer membrane [Arcicella aurantiaca]
MKINKNIIKTLGLTSVLFAASSCSLTDFGDMNVTPNAIATPVTSALLTNSLIAMDGPATTGGLLGSLYCQYISETQYTESSNYSTQQVAWDGIYAGMLYDLQNIINQNSNAATAVYASNNGSNKNQIAIARIIKAYTFLTMTDRWGDIPMSEALQEKINPKYDSQQEVYTALFKELKEAAAQFDGGVAVKGDILFAGDATKWKKFANSLRLVMALRISKIDPTTGKAQFIDALSGGVIDANADNAAITYPGGTFKNPWFSLYDGRKDYALSSQFATILSDNQDARLQTAAAPNGKGQIAPMPYGLTRDVATSATYADFSFVLAPALRAATSQSFILTAAHAYLARAEAAQLGWTSENVKDMYSKGIEMSWKQWGVFDQTKFNTFMTSANIDLASNAMTKIQTQRYVAFFPDGNMGWAEWRRTGVPALKPSVNATNSSKQIPRRYAYGTNESTINGVNYKAAAAKLTGGDTQDSRVWWDK